MKAIDLHVHSTYSDGTSTPAELVDNAIEAGLSAIALTDHDTMEGVAEILAYAKDKEIEIVPGIELSTEYFQRDIHILGLYMNPENPAFTEHIRTFQESRVIRNQKMCQLLAKEGIDITYEALTEAFEGAIITRAHYARFLMEKGYVKSMREAFERYVGDHCKAFVPREKITPAEAVQLILKAGGIPVLAHPILYRFSDKVLDELVSSLKEAGLMGIETVYSTYAPSEERFIRRLANKYDLLITGGSDYHGSNKPDIRLGVGRGNLFVPEEYLDRLKDAYLARFAPQKDSKCMLFFDLDGTLLNDEKTISPETRAALQKCVDKGHLFAISSGRAFRSIEMLIERLDLAPLNPFISAYNGSLIGAYGNPQKFYQARLSLDIVKEIQRMANAMNIHIQSYSENGILSCSETKELAFYCKFTLLPYDIIKDLAGDGREPYKLLAIHLENKELLYELKHKTDALLGDVVDTFFSNDYFLEFMPKGVGKGSALEFLCNHTGIDIANSYAFADAENDVSMLHSGGHGLALLNAQPEAKRAADYITFTDNNHEGLACFLNEIASN